MEDKIELKTLKDLKSTWFNIPEIDVFYDEIKAEAVKRVKDNLLIIDKLKFTFEGRQCSFCGVYYGDESKKIDELIIVNSFIVDFFNINEEDLK